MPKTIYKKTWPKFFEAIASGSKTWEMRLQDFDVAEGDTLVLQEWNPETKQYTGRSITKRVGYVGRFKMDDPKLLTIWSPDEIRDKGFQIISLV